LIVLLFAVFGKPVIQLHACAFEASQALTAPRADPCEERSQWLRTYGNK
jgi:hypothetical protein